MTNEEIDAGVEAGMSRIERAKDKLVAHVPMLISVLEDAQRPAAAKQLRELMFNLDVENQEMEKFVLSDARAILLRFLERARKK